LSSMGPGGARSLFGLQEVHGLSPWSTQGWWLARRFWATGEARSRSGLQPQCGLSPWEHDAGLACISLEGYSGGEHEPNMACILSVGYPLWSSFAWWLAKRSRATEGEHGAYLACTAFRWATPQSTRSKWLASRPWAIRGSTATRWLTQRQWATPWQSHTQARRRDGALARASPFACALRAKAI